MKFKIDENLPAEFADMLRSEGHDAVTVLEERLGGAPDVEIFLACKIEERALLTLDLDFADIRFYPPAESPGVIVFRIQPQDKDHLIESLRRTIPFLQKESVANRLWIVEENRIRIREEMGRSGTL